MAKQRYINTRFWRDNYVADLDPSEKLLFLYCLTNPDTNICGIYEIPLKTISIDTGFDKDMVSKMLDRFERDEKIAYIDGWIAIRNFIQHQALNPKIVKGIHDEMHKIPENVVEWCEITPESLSDLNTNYNTNTNSNRAFKKPTIDEIAEYMKEKRITAFKPESFYYYYESKDWMVGKNKMKSWRSAVHTWMLNAEKYDKKPEYEVLNG